MLQISSFFKNLLKMPRKALAPISNNIRAPNSELSPYIRGKIIGLADAGISQYQIASRFDLSRATIQSTLRRDLSQQDGKSSKRSGRPSIVTPQTRRLILRNVRKDPKISKKELHSYIGTNLSMQTMHRILKTEGITKWRAKKRPILTEEHAAARLAWALEHKDWTRKEWDIIMWSDECSVERGSGYRAK